MTRRRWIADRVEGDHAWLLGPNANHLFRVLRVKVGQTFEVAADGVPRFATVVSASHEQVEFHLGAVVESEALPQITVYLSIFKFDRLEWALEKLTELGNRYFSDDCAADGEALSQGGQCSRGTLAQDCP